jgi:tetratricopeptide (TPR) repeat protein
VSNPHDFLVQAATDWGVLGLLGVAAMLVGATWVVSEPTKSCNSPSRAASISSRSHVLAWGIALLAVVTVGRLPLLGSDDPNYLYYHTVIAGAVWVVGYAVFALALFREEAAGARLLTLRRGILAGLFAFLLHELINFALFVPGAAMTFFALFAMYIAENEETTRPRHAPTWRRWLPASGFASGAMTIVLLGILPVGRAARYLEEARKAAARGAPQARDVQSAVMLFDEAARADSLDATPLVEQARWWVARPHARGSPDDLASAARALEAAILRDPWNLGLRRMLSRVVAAKASITGSEPDYQEAVTAARAACRIYPRDPATVVLLGDGLLELAKASRSEAAAREAIDRYEAALALDEARWSGERYHRFREREIQEVKNKLAQARGLLSTPP